MQENRLWNRGMLVLFVVVLLTALVVTAVYHVSNQGTHHHTDADIELGNHMSWDGGIYFDGRELFPVSYGDLTLIGLPLQK